MMPNKDRIIYRDVVYNIYYVSTEVSLHNYSKSSGVIN